MLDVAPATHHVSRGIGHGVQRHRAMTAVVDGHQRGADVLDDSEGTHSTTMAAIGIDYQRNTSTMLSQSEGRQT